MGKSESVKELLTMSKLGRRLYKLSEFCREEGVYRDTVIRSWLRSGRAPRMARYAGRYYVTSADWADWLQRRQADRTRTGNLGLRAPLAATPKTKSGKIKFPAPSVEGL
jgi:hypothetical protein